MPRIPVSELAPTFVPFKTAHEGDQYTGHMMPSKSQYAQGPALAHEGDQYTGHMIPSTPYGQGPGTRTYHPPPSYAYQRTPNTGVGITLADFSPASNLAAIQKFLDSAHDTLGQGDIAASDTDAVQAYRRAGGFAQDAAGTAKNMVDTIVEANPSLGSKYSTSIAAWNSATTNSSDAAGRTNVRAQAANLAVTAVHAAEQAQLTAVNANKDAATPSRIQLGTTGWLILSAAVAGAAYLGWRHWGTKRLKP